MCHELYWRRRREEAEESRELWADFDRARPIAEPELPPEVTEPEPTEVREAIGTPER